MVIPHIAIPSYLGSTPEVREKRLESHAKQRDVLQRCFPRLRILSICSDYQPREKKKLRKYECLFLPGRVLKYKKHNMILEKLYQKGPEHSVLFLDDDVIPVTKTEEPFLDTVCAIKMFLAEENPYQCVYFSCKGLFHDIYNAPRVREGEVVVEAPIETPGWAMLVRGDLGVMYDDEMCIEPKTGLVLDDLPFRCKCYAEGKPVMKHLACYFDSYHKTANRTSAFFESEEQWRATREAHLDYLLVKHPLHFEKVKGKVRFRRNHSEGFGFFGSKT